MANPKHSEAVNDARHLPKDFELAANSTVLSKDEFGNLIYVPKNDVGGSQGPQGDPGELTPEQERLLANDSSTGVLTGGDITTNADPTKFDISAGRGVIIDSFTDPLNPVIFEVVWTAFLAEIVPDLASSDATFIGLQKGAFNVGSQTYDGAVVLKTTAFTNDELRDTLGLGVLAHPSRTVVDQSITGQIFVSNPINQVSDLALAIGNINITGNVFSANGANLSLNKSQGQTFRFGISSFSNKRNPNVKINPATVAGQFFYSYQDGSGGTTVIPGATDVIPGSYDDGTGVLAVVAANRFSIHRIFFTASGSVAITFGQALYNNLSDAEAALNTEIFVKPPGLTGQPLRSWLIMRGDITDLTAAILAGTAKFINAGKFDESLAGGASTSTTTLQQAYANSVEPEILLDAIRLALTIRDNSTPITGPLFEVQNNAADRDYFIVAADEIVGETQAYTKENTLVDGANIATDLSLGNAHTVVLGGNRTLINPTNLKAGASYTWIIAQDGTGSRTLAYGSVFKFEDGLLPVLTTTASAVDILSGISDGTNIYAQLIKDFK